MTTMRRVRAALLRASTLFRREAAERELAAEMESHLQLHIHDNLRAGMTPAEARRQAVLALGGVEQAKEHYRDRRGLPWAEALLQDVRFAARVLRRQPTFTAVAVLTLAIGFGPPIAIYTLADWMVLRAVPGVHEPEAVSLFMTGTPSPRGGTTVGRVSYLNLRDITEQLETVRLAGFQVSGGSTVAGNGRPERFSQIGFVSGSFFDVLGVRMQHGRPFGDREDDPGSPALVAVIGDSLWASLFDRDPAAVGQLLTINGHAVTIVGVADRHFQGVERLELTSLWLPGVTEPILRNLQGRSPADRAAGGYYRFAGRLVPGATWPQVDAELAALPLWLTEQYPAENEKFKTVAFHSEGPMNAYGREHLLPLLALMFGASALVLLIACSNVTSMILMRGLTRQGEVAVRTAIGAGRWRVVRQHVTEMMFLWLLGGLAGMGLVWALMRSSVISRLPILNVPDVHIPLEWRVLGFAAALSLGVGLLMSLGPSLRTTRVNPAAMLQGAGGKATGRFGTAWLLTAVQLSASLALVVGALMLAATLRNLAAVDLGFDPDNLTVVRIRPPANATSASAHAHVQAFIDHLALRPGVEAVAAAYEMPFVGSRFFGRVRRAAPESFVETNITQVATPNYFATLGVSLLRGRAFSEAEIEVPGVAAAPAVIVSVSLARQLFGTIDIVGQTVEMPIYQQGPRAYEVIGVAADARFFDFAEGPQPMLYRPDGYARARTGMALLVRAASGVRIADEAQAVTASLDVLSPYDIRSMNDAVGRARAEWDLLASLMIALAAIASILAAVGVYGVIAFAAASRRAEFGIRLALGASARAVRAQVLRGAVRLAVAGLLFGGAGAYALMQILRGRLVGVSPMDPAIWTAAAMALIALVALASYLPARAASRVNLTDTLKAM